MGNTLCIYDGDVQTRQIACLVGSVLSMSAYAAYTETMNWDRYERIVFVMGPRQAMFSHFAAWQPALQHKKLAFCGMISKISIPNALPRLSRPGWAGPWM